jgi:hypothetical protein
VTTLPTVTLEADLSSRPARWPLVAFIPFGTRPHQLEYVLGHESPTIEPNSFAVAPDGSFWFVDPANHRIVHFARRGAYIEDRGGYSFVSTDMGFVGPDLFTVRQTQNGAVDEWTPDRGLVPAVLNDHGLRPYITQLVPTPDGLFALVDTPPPADGPHGSFRVNLELAGQLEPVPGVPVGPGSWATVDSSDNEDIEVTFAHNGGQTVLETFHVQVVAHPNGKRLVATLGAGNLVPDGEDLYLYVRISASEAHGVQVGARYLLRVGRSGIIWERVRQPRGIDDATQRRFITLGPDGHVYLMVTDRDGVRIYRRPT